jgi:hypothetical protein
VCFPSIVSRSLMSLSENAISRGDFRGVRTMTTCLPSGVRK